MKTRMWLILLLLRLAVVLIEGRRFEIRAQRTSSYVWPSWNVVVAVVAAVVAEVAHRRVAPASFSSFRWPSSNCSTCASEWPVRTEC